MVLVEGRTSRTQEQVARSHAATDSDQSWVRVDCAGRSRHCEISYADSHSLTDLVNHNRWKVFQPIVMSDICVKLSGTLLDFRVESIILSDEQILLCRLTEESWWYPPGGRIRTGKSSLAAIHRELEE